MEESSNQDNYARAIGDLLSRSGTGEPTIMRRPTFPGDYPRTPNECVKRNKARGIQISQQDHGYIVNVGCQTLVFENMNTLIEKLTAYLKDPDAVEKKWMTEGVL